MRPDEAEFVKKMISEITDERVRRLFLGGYASLTGYGGISELNQCVGVSRTTITRGSVEYSELDPEHSEDDNEEAVKTRQKGGGRKKLTSKYPQLIDTMYSMMQGNPSGNPGSTLCWTTMNLEAIQSEFLSKGIEISIPKIRELFSELHIDLRRYIENKCSPEKLEKLNAQYNFIQVVSRLFIQCHFPVIYIDINLTDPCGNDTIDLILAAINLWRMDEIRNHHSYKESSSVMIVLGSHKLSLAGRPLCEPVAQKASALLGKNVLVSILPDGISKWVCSREYLKLQNEQLVLSIISTDQQEKAQNKSVQDALILKLSEKVTNYEMDYFCMHGTDA